MGMSLLRAAITGVGLLAVPVAAIAETPAVLLPNSPWNLRYEENSCQLVRSFGDKARPTIMVLERAFPRSGMSLLVFGGALKSQVGDRDGKAAFLPFSANVFDYGLVSETAVKHEPAIFWSGVDFRAAPYSKAEREALQNSDVRDLAREAADDITEQQVAKAVTGLEITERGTRKLVLRTGPFDRANALMRDCANQQLVRWGVDPKVEEKIVRPAKPVMPVAGLFNSDDYPREALDEGAQSIISARLLIDANGNMTKCTSLTAYKEPSFAQVVCKRFQQAKFRPAELADGTKVPSYYTATIRFMMPT